MTWSLHLRLSSSGVGLPCTGADCLKEEASTYFSLELSVCCSGASSTSRILFWVSIGKRWRGILKRRVFFSSWLTIVVCNSPVTGFEIFPLGEKQSRCKLTSERNCCQVDLNLRIRNESYWWEKWGFVFSPVCLVSDPHRWCYREWRPWLHPWLGDWRQRRRAGQSRALATFLQGSKCQVGLFNVNVFCFLYALRLHCRYSGSPDRLQNGMC